MNRKFYQEKAGGIKISRIVNIVPNDDFTLLIEFEHGNKVLFDMKRLVTTMPYYRLRDLECFKKVRFEDKAVFWDTEPPGQAPAIVKLTVDNILFAIRD